MPTKNCEVDVEYGTELAEQKIHEIGDAITSINPQAIVEVAYEVYSEVTHTWQQVVGYYPRIEEIINQEP